MRAFEAILLIVFLSTIFMSHLFMVVNRRPPSIYCQTGGRALAWALLTSNSFERFNESLADFPDVKYVAYCRSEVNVDACAHFVVVYPGDNGSLGVRIVYVGFKP